MNATNVQNSKKMVNGVTYRKLKPEVKLTLEKVVYQLELVAKTLQLMEQRVMNSEDKLQEVMDYIKHNDLDFVSLLYLFIYIFLQQPTVINRVLSMNKYDEITGNPIHGDSPQKSFGLPLPGDPSIMYTMQKNQLPNLHEQYVNKFLSTMEDVNRLTGNFN